MAESKAPSRQLIIARLASFLFLILLQFLGCFVFSAAEKLRRGYAKNDTSTAAKKRSGRAIIAPVVSFLRGIFSSKSAAAQTHPTTPPRSSSQHSAVSAAAVTDLLPSPDANPRKRQASMTESEIELFGAFPLSNDIFPCTACGEIFQKAQALESHRAARHALSDLPEGDSAKNIVQIIFNNGWNNNDEKTTTTTPPEIRRVLKIHSSAKMVARFEEHREAVKARAAGRRRDERCGADGNEVLRFHCATFVCELGAGGGLCGHGYCGVCGIIRLGFSPKLDGVSTMSTTRGAHSALPDDVEEEFAFMNVRRAVLVCRVVAGRVGREGDAGDKDGGFDSVLVARPAGDELLVFNPRAVLPCFVIVYTV